MTNNANASEAELSSLLSKLTQLDELSLVNNANLTDSVMAAIGNNNPKLVKLDVSKAKQITDNGIDHITTLSALESLNISFCANTGDKSLALIGQNLNNLETLNISSCATATDNGIAHLDNLSKLSTLTMQSLPKITAKALSHIPQSVNKLVAAFCPGIDSLDGLRAVSHFVFVNLMNTKIADKDIMRFTESKNMKFLGIMNCPNITVDGLREFIRNEPNPNIGIATNLKP